MINVGVNTDHKTVKLLTGYSVKLREFLLSPDILTMVLQKLYCDFKTMLLMLMVIRIFPPKIKNDCRKVFILSSQPCAYNCSERRNYLFHSRHCDSSFETGKELEAITVKDGPVSVRVASSMAIASTVVDV